MSSYFNRLRNANYCKYKCLRAEPSPRDPNIPAIEQSSAYQSIKYYGQGGTPVFRSFAVNQFGRILGTGGQPPTNFR